MREGGGEGQRESFLEGNLFEGGLRDLRGGFLDGDPLEGGLLERSLPEEGLLKEDLHD